MCPAVFAEKLLINQSFPGLSCVFTDGHLFNTSLKGCSTKTLSTTRTESLSGPLFELRGLDKWRAYPWRHGHVTEGHISLRRVGHCVEILTARSSGYFPTATCMCWCVVLICREQRHPHHRGLYFSVSPCPSPYRRTSTFKIPACFYNISQRKYIRGVDKVNAWMPNCKCATLPW